MTDSSLIEPQPKAARPDPETHEFMWTSGWLTIRIGVKFTPLLFGYIDHLEIRSLEPAKTPLPLSKTGYHSHYVSPGQVVGAGGAIEATRILLDDAAGSLEWQASLQAMRQPFLF